MTPPHESNSVPSKRSGPGCISLCVTGFLVLVGLLMLIDGEVIIPYRAVYITGVPARIFAVLWIVIVIGLSLTTRKGE